MTFEQRFTEYTTPLRARVEKALDRYSQFGDGCPDRLREAIRHSLLAPAKRLRPMLVLLACEACGGDVETALPAASAVEMIHTYSLIHDDLPAMDDDDLRRGLPTCHVKFGEATAILAGDALLARAFEVMASDVRPPELAARCCAELAQAAGATELVGGQSDDLAAETAPPGNLQALEAIHRRKTGAMFRVSLRLGGMLAGARPDAMQALTDYGNALGLAFQIVDDLLDLQGDGAALGKRVHKDHDRGKLTFPSLLGIEPSRAYAAQRIEEAVAAARRLGPPAAMLEQLARYVLERTR